MPQKLRTFLSLEPLESRETPASVANAVMIFGTLFINGDNAGDNVVVNEVSPGQFGVTINNVSKGQFAAKNIIANLGTGNDTFDLNVQTALPGFLTVNLGNGNDSFTTKNSAIGAQINGTVMVNTGLSPQLLNNYDEVVELYNLNFNGLWVQVNGTFG